MIWYTYPGGSVAALLVGRELAETTRTRAAPAFVVRDLPAGSPAPGLLCPLWRYWYVPADQAAARALMS